MSNNIQAFNLEKEIQTLRKVLSDFISGKYKGWVIYPDDNKPAYKQKFLIKEKWLFGISSG